MFITYKPYMAQSASNNLRPQESATNWRNNISPHWDKGDALITQLLVSSNPANL